MDKKLVIAATVCAILLATLITAINPLMLPVHADGTTVYLVPSTISYTSPPVTVGTLFEVAVWVDNVTDLCAYQIQIRYDNTTLDCYDAIEPTSNPDYVLHSIVPQTFITENYKTGEYTIAGSELPGGTPAKFNGTGLVTIFAFNVTQVPPEGGTLNSTLNVNNDQTFLLDRNGAQIPIGIEDGSYELGPDITPPVIEIVSPKASKVYNETDIPLNFTIDEPTSWIGYSLKGAANVTITGNTTLTGLVENVTSYTVVVYANDTSGNMGASSTVSFKVDLSAPIIDTPTRVPAGDVEPSVDVVVSVNVTDAITQVKKVILWFTNDTTTWYNMTMSYNLTSHKYQATIPGHSAGTTVNYKITAYDMADNMAIKDNAGEYYTYTVVPEFSSALMLFLLLAIATFFVVFAKKRAHLDPKK
jgi:hypothetical protein